MNTIYTSARLRAVLTTELGSVFIAALQNHINDLAAGEFDPKAHWQTANILELSEMAHRLDALAEGLDTTNPLKIEMMRLSKGIMQNFTAVYDIAMERLAQERNYGFKG